MLLVAFLPDRLDLRNDQARTGERGDLACHAENRQAVGAVGRELERHDVLVELEQAGVVVGEAEIFRGAEHALALDAADRGLPDLAARQLGAHLRQRHPHADAHVRRAADHTIGFTARRDGAHGELVGVRVLADRAHFGGDHAGDRGHRGLVGLDFDARHRQPLGELRAGQLGITEASQPALGNDHENCSRKRRSPSKNSRRSSMP
jgi:hypothetical protein